MRLRLRGALYPNSKADAAAETAAGCRVSHDGGCVCLAFPKSSKNELRRWGYGRVPLPLGISLWEWVIGVMGCEMVKITCSHISNRKGRLPFCFFLLLDFFTFF